MEPDQEHESWIDSWKARLRRVWAWAKEDLKKDPPRYGLKWWSRSDDPPSE